MSGWRPALGRTFPLDVVQRVSRVNVLSLKELSEGERRVGAKLLPPQKLISVFAVT